MESNQYHTNNFKFLPHLIFIVFLALIVWSVYMLNKGTIDPHHPNEATLKIEIIGPTEITLDNKMLKTAEFSSQLTSRVTELESKGISKEGILCSISAKENVKLGEVCNVQEQLRNLGVRKIAYQRQ
jgi:biopolymer transport protein ExbD